jgi:hypothetical protein
MANQINYGKSKHDREIARAARREQKLDRRRQRSAERSDPSGRTTRFASAFPDAPEAYDGIARTLSRGL